MHSTDKRCPQLHKKIATLAICAPLYSVKDDSATKEFFCEIAL